jgi:hypothetical protein
MAKATDDYTIIGPILPSAVIADPFVRDAFRRTSPAVALPAPGSGRPTLAARLCCC